MFKALLRTLINMFGVICALLLVPGIAIERRLVALGFAFLLGLFNTLLKPILVRLSIGCSLITLAPFLLIVNTMAIFIIGDQLGLGISVDGFWPAFWSGLIVSIISYSVLFLVSD